jgi:hypothetical protein
VIVWIASFPRSGNTFLRILLHRLYGVASSVVYDVDGVAERLGEAMVGFEQRPASYEEMRASDAVHFIKTHRQRDADIKDGDRAICLVRDGRDSLVSWARMQSEADAAQFEVELRKMIERNSPTGTGSWGANVLSWLRPETSNRAVLRYEALVADPVGAVTTAMAALVPEMSPGAAEVPDFAELRTADGLFFRRGIVGSHRDEMPGELHELFWSRPGNAAAMVMLGYARADA